MWEPCAHFSKRDHDDVHNETHQDVSDEHGTRTAVLQRTARADNETGSYRASNRHLDHFTMLARRALKMDRVAARGRADLPYLRGPY